LVQAGQGPIFRRFGVLGFAEGVAQALVAAPATDLHHKTAWLGMDELRLDLHGFAVAALGWVHAF
jgi:hypothetical protein